MLIGQTLIAPAAGADYYGPWMPRQGNSMKAAVQYLNSSAALESFTCTVQTKNHEDSDNSPTNLATMTVTNGSPNEGRVSTITAAGCLELVRYKYSVAATSGTEWVHFRRPQPHLAKELTEDIPMDTMILGETIAHNDAEEITTYLGFWMPSGGSEGVGACETFLVSTASVFTIRMETKSSDDADPATPVFIGSQTISKTTPDVHKFDLTDAKDLVRYVIECSSEAVEHLHFQLCQPLWAPN